MRCLRDPSGRATVRAVDVVRLLERLHGHVGWLAVAALVHPALLLRRRTRADLAVGLAVAIATVVSGAGAALYIPYRARIKPLLFQTEPAAGWLFERKEQRQGRDDDRAISRREAELT